MQNLNHSKIAVWEKSGILVLIILGGLIHFIYEWSNFNPIIGALAPVNESVWEHLKLGYLSLLLFSLAEYPFIKGNINNYFAAKAAGILALELPIVIVFYTYTPFVGHPILFIDISMYVVGCILCQLVCLRLMRAKKLPKILNIAGLIIILVLGLCFIYFTFYPPKLHIFKDLNSGTYGIQK